MDPKRLVAQSGTLDWYKARERGVSATTVAKAAAGAKSYDHELNRALHPEDHVVEDNDYMRFGREWETWIVAQLPTEYGLEANDWLIRGDLNDTQWHLATPDGLTADWSTICEVKTTGKDFDKTIPIQYRRQVQWQLHVTGATRCVFAWLLRVEDEAGNFQPGWMEPKHTIIERDENMIADLIDVANRFITDYNNYKTLNKEMNHG